MKFSVLMIGLFLSSCLSLTAQQAKFKIDGIVLNESKVPFDQSIRIFIVDDKKTVASTIALKNGAYTLNHHLECNKIYHIHFSPESKYYPKIIELDLKNLTDLEDIGLGIKMELEITLIAKKKGRKLRFLNTIPVGRMIYNSESTTIEPDNAYNTKMKNKIEKAKK